MTGILYDRLVLIDTSAVIALYNPSDQFHNEAETFFYNTVDFVWCTVSTTAHELFTRSRYDEGLREALERFDFLRSERFRLLSFNINDEQKARGLLERYNDQTLSFHDALCAVIMLRAGIYKIFSFDRGFWILGLEVMPGRTA